MSMKLAIVVACIFPSALVGFDVNTYEANEGTLVWRSLPDREREFSLPLQTAVDHDGMVLRIWQKDDAFKARISLNVETNEAVVVASRGGQMESEKGWCEPARIHWHRTDPFEVLNSWGVNDFPVENR